MQELRKKAEQGIPAAQFALGAKYANGEDLTQNYPVAVKWFSKAAEQGHVLAAATLGAVDLWNHPEFAGRSTTSSEAAGRERAVDRFEERLAVLTHPDSRLVEVTFESADPQLAAHPNIAGMKESGGDAARINDLVSGTPERFQVLAGTASTFYSALCVGATLPM